jgi:hypothetical protein
MYRQLLVLQRLFQFSPDGDEIDPLTTGDRVRDAAFCAAIAETIDELTEHGRILTSVPFPISEWREGEGPDDERWRALTEIERREVLALLSGYEALIAWVDETANGSSEFARFAEGSDANGGGSQAVVRRARSSQPTRDAADYLKGERSRVGRFRQELAFLERRRSAG